LHRVLFVCLGNICRSPTAEGVFRAKAEAAGLSTHLTIDSAGTSNYHPGEPPDARSQANARRRGYDLSKLRARAVTEADFERFDLLIAMDDLNYSTLLNRADPLHHSKIYRMMAFASSDKFKHVREVPDPYTGGKEDFEYVLDLLEDASEGLVIHLRGQIGV
jgi:protein-tyrosine phosphatase